MLLLLGSLLDSIDPVEPPDDARLGGFEMSRPVRWVEHKTIFDKIKERAKEHHQHIARLRAGKAAKRKARAIEDKAARIVIEHPADAESQFMDLMRQWAAFNPVAVGPQDTTLEQLFAAEIAFRVRAIQQQIEAEMDEEEAIIALLLA